MAIYREIGTCRPKKIMKKNNDFNYLGTFTLILWPNYTKDYK